MSALLLAEIESLRSRQRSTLRLAAGSAAAALLLWMLVYPRAGALWVILFPLGFAALMLWGALGLNRSTKRLALALAAGPAGRAKFRATEVKVTGDPEVYVTVTLPGSQPRPAAEAGVEWEGEPQWEADLAGDVYLDPEYGDWIAIVAPKCLVHREWRRAAEPSVAADGGRKLP